MNRLRHYGLVDNVALFPHGIVNMPISSKEAVRQLVGLGSYGPIIASSGFLLPGKGLPELISAFSLLLNEYPQALLLLVNADYPNIVSQTEREICKEIICSLGIENNVILINDYLEYEQSLLLMQAADIIAYTYQQTGESSSASVRMGLISRRPVACTPLQIFADLKDCVYRMPGIKPEEIAQGLSLLLRDKDLQQRLVEASSAWIDDNSWERVGERLSGIFIGCFQDATGKSVHPVPEVAAFRRTETYSDIRVDDLADLSTEAFIRIICQRIQNRPADDQDYGKYGTALNSGAMTRDKVVEDLLLSAPTAANIDVDVSSLLLGPIKPHHVIKVDFARMLALNEEMFVEAAYRILLGRPSDRGGRNGYLLALRNGTLSKKALIENIMRSEEFRALDRPIILT